MKIEATENRIFRYLDINAGECFIYEADLYLKTWGDELDDSAVNLKTGEIIFFDGAERVQPIVVIARMQ